MADDKVGLGAAAAALEAELRRFEQVTDLAARLELKSQKNLERAARAAQDAAEAQARVAEKVSALIEERCWTPCWPGSPGWGTKQRK